MKKSLFWGFPIQPAHFQPVPTGFGLKSVPIWFSKMTSGEPNLISGEPKVIFGEPNPIFGEPNLISGEPKVISGASKIVSARSANGLHFRRLRGGTWIRRRARGSAAILHCADAFDSERANSARPRWNVRGNGCGGCA